MKKSSIRFIIVVFFLSIILFATNPSKEDFISYIKSKFAEETNMKTKSLERLFSKAKDWAALELVKRKTSRKDFILFSVYIIKIGEEEIYFIGLLSHFLPISKEVAGIN